MNPKNIRDIAIDFEGGKSKDGKTPKFPTLLGAILPDQRKRGAKWNYRCYLFAPELEPMTRRVRGLKGTRLVSTFDHAIRELVEEAEQRDCHLVAYTEFELNQVEAFLQDQDLWDRFKFRYRNIAENVREHLKATGRRPATGKLTLQVALQRMGSHLLLEPKPVAAGVGAACKRLITAGTRTKRWRKWTRSQQQVAKDLLVYNRQDCKAIRDLISRLEVQKGHASKN